MAWSSAGGIGFKGSRKGTPFAATQAAICGGQRRQGVRHAQRRGARQGTGRRPRVGDPRAADDRHRREVDPRRHADSAQRLPAAEAAARLRRSGAASSLQLPAAERDAQRELAADSWKLEATRNQRMARYIGSGLPAVPARRHEALPEGRALLHGEVRDREAQPAARAARQAAQGEAGRLRPAAAREAEGQAHLRRAREPVPPLLRDGGPARAASPARRCCSCSSAGSTTSSTGSASRPRARRRGSSCATATSWSTAGRSTCRRTRSRPATWSTVRGTSAQNATIQHAMEEVKGRGIPEWLSFDAGQHDRPRSRRCRRASRSTCPCRSS